jgi:hypothetical protein
LIHGPGGEGEGEGEGEEEEEEVLSRRERVWASSILLVTPIIRGGGGEEAEAEEAEELREMEG